MFESQFLKIENPVGNSKSIIVGNIYRRPIDNQDNYMGFIEEFQVIVDSLAKGNKNTLICGDFNMDLLQLKNKPAVNDFLDVLLSTGFIPTITYPTRLNPNHNSASLIDNVFAKITQSVINCTSGILTNRTSDHMPIFTLLDLFFTRRHSEYIEIKNK